MTVLTYANAFPGIPLPQHFGWTGPTSGLIHRWQMDDASVSGSNLSDLAGTDTATIVGGVTSTASPSGAFASTARAFDGTTGYLTLGSFPLPALPSDLTIAFWINYPDITYTPFSSANNPRVLYFQDGTNQVQFVNPAGTANLEPGWASINYSGGVTQNWLSSAAVFADNTWAHLAMTVASGASSAQFYINGSSITTNSNPGQTQTTAGSANQIGSRSGADRTFKGSLYQLVIYNRILSSTEVTTLFNAG